MACGGSSPNLVAGGVAASDINDCITIAVNGDTISVPSGSATWSTKITTQGKYFTLSGAGIGRTIITDGVTNDQVGEPNQSLFELGLNGAGVTRITGFTFRGRNRTGPGILQTLPSSAIHAQIRIDHNRWEPDLAPALQFYGCVEGVMDHNEVILKNSGGYWFYAKNGMGCLGGADDWGDEGWSDGTVFGTSHKMFFEDNTISAPNDAGVWVGDGFNGGRYVFRFNTIANSNAVTTHGISSGGRYRGHRHAEYYGNTHSRAGSIVNGAAFGINSGTGIAFDNQISGQFSAFGTIDAYRDPTFGGTLDFAPWSRRAGQLSITSITRSGSTATVTTASAHNIQTHSIAVESMRITGATGGDASLYNGIFPVTVTGTTTFTYTMSGTPGANASGTLFASVPWDGNEDQFGYPLLDQPGVGSGTEINNNVNPTPVPVHPASGLNQTKQPIYVWNNTLGGVLTGMRTVCPNTIVENRDFYNEVTPFTGASGVGKGLRSARPSTCTTGVGWWSTDQGSWNSSISNPHGVQRSGASGVLDVCTSTNTWTNGFWVPDAYPHPLNTSGGGSPPVSYLGLFPI